MKRSLRLTAETLRAYSRAGNFHSDPAAAAALGRRGLVAQGMQVAAPAYAIALDAWGDDFLERGVLELRFVAPVVVGVDADGTDVDADVTIDDSRARLEVVERHTTRTAVVGTFDRSG